MAIDEKTKAIYVETIANPGYTLSNISALSKIAHNASIPLIVDNTLGMGGYLICPIKHEADIILHSTTKWVVRHGTTIGGVITNGGTFD
ncbi:hypothetical protein H2248_011975 [Termitomyces sp. 'cryptogamus']|nr:hypothetical protein H2248_011975 [Termitomyces sp. 'cryptogamus']